MKVILRLRSGHGHVGRDIKARPFLTGASVPCSQSIGENNREIGSGGFRLGFFPVRMRLPLKAVTRNINGHSRDRYSVWEMEKTKGRFHTGRITATEPTAPPWVCAWKREGPLDPNRGLR